MMPYKSGLEQHIVSKYPSIPVIIVSALGKKTLLL
jgi:hypothetical protein